MIEKATKRSRALFKSGFYCAESVLLAVSEAMGVESDLIPKIATGFCSGMARTGSQCGALSGGMMGISLFTGRCSPEDSVDKNYAKVRELVEAFESRFGSTSCYGLTGCDLNTEQGQVSFDEKNLIEKCYSFTEEATRITMRLLEG